jgi:hypothetical protein
MGDSPFLFKNSYHREASVDERIWRNKGNPKKKAGDKKIRKDNKDSFHKLKLSKERLKRDTSSFSNDFIHL